MHTETMAQHVHSSAARTIKVWGQSTHQQDHRTDMQSMQTMRYYKAVRIRSYRDVQGQMKFSTIILSKEGTPESLHTERYPLL